MTFAQLFCIAAVWLLGGFIHGVTSIGGGMIAMPVVTFLTTPRDAILISCLTGFTWEPTAYLWQSRYPM